jgi:hypothetical protein
MTSLQTFVKITGMVPPLFCYSQHILAWASAMTLLAILNLLFLGVLWLVEELAARLMPK